MKKLFRNLRILFRQNHDLSTPEGRAHERTRRIALTAVTAALSKVFSTVIPLVTVRVSLAYLGEETYGLWMATTSLFSLFAFTDLGLGNGLQTALSRMHGRDDLDGARGVISSTYAMLLGVSGVLLLAMLAVYPRIDWAVALGAESAATQAIAGAVVLAIVLPKIVNIPIGIVQRTQLALQEGYRFNLWHCAGSLLSLASVYVISSLDLGPVALIAGSASVGVFVSLLNMLVFYGVQRTELRPRARSVSRGTALAMLRTGAAFFLLSILTTGGISSVDSFIVGRSYGLVESSWYSIALRVSQLLGTVATMLTTPLWGANGEALARGDIQWVRRNTRRLTGIMLGATAGASALILLLAGPLFGLWLGRDFSVPTSVLSGMLAMQVLRAGISPYMMAINAANRLRAQILAFLVFTPLSFGLKLLGSQSLGVAFIPWIGAACYALIICPVVFVSARRLLREKEAI